MFFGPWHTIVEAGTSTTVNEDVMCLAANPEECRQLMQELLADSEIDAASSGHEPGLHCVPQNVQSWDASLPAGVSGSIYNAESHSTDSSAWHPELPVRLCIYHCFVRGFLKDVSKHSIFLGVTGCCTLAAESFYNLLLDIRTDTDVD
eukprot:2259103-Rhodomonas_salina.1